MSTVPPEYTGPFLGKAFREGFKEGFKKGQARALVAFLEARGLEVSERVRERITGCDDLDLLARWIRRAAAVESSEQLFG